MTTGRINQVTIAGRGESSRAAPSGDGETTAEKRPAARPPPHGRRPTFTESKRPTRGTSCKASHTSDQRRGSDGLASRSPAPPEESTAAGSTPRDTVSTLRLHAKRCNPHCTDGRHGTRGDLPTSACGGSNRTAEQAGQCLSRNAVPHAAPRQDARQSNVCYRFHLHAQLPGRLGTGTVRLPTCQTSRRCSPHSSLRTLIESGDDPISTRRTTDDGA